MDIFESIYWVHSIFNVNQNNYSRKIIDPNSKFIVVATGGSNRILEGINILKIWQHENVDNRSW